LQKNGVVTVDLDGKLNLPFIVGGVFLEWFPKGVFSKLDDLMH
jgi:hypothetical protein